MINVRPARIADAGFIGRNLRMEDEREVRAATGRAPSRVVAESFQLSRESYVVFRRGFPDPYAIFGVADDPTVEGLGIVWMLCTDEVSRAPLDTFRAGHGWMDYLSRHYPLGMHNLAHKENLLHVRWCRLSGFAELGEVQHRGHPFIHIHRPTQHV
jgi:hypothetical protein